MEALKFDNVRFSYADTNQDNAQDVFAEDAFFAIDGVTLSVQEGEFVAVLGHNGSGKSTLARLTNGLLTPTDGNVTVLGMDISNSKNLFEIRKGVGIVFQNPDNQTVASIVEDDIAFGPENVGLPRTEIGERIDFALDAVGMQAYRHSTTERLSGGQKQRIAIAGVLALKPRIMILDEATAMLDPRGRKEVMDVVLRLNKEEKITVLLITHFPEEALLADRAIVMHQGKIVMEGKPETVLSDEKRLEEYALKLPRSLRVCHALQQGGIPVENGMNAYMVAQNIVKALPNADVKQMGAPLEKQENNQLEGEIGRIVCENLAHVYNPKSPFATYALNGVDLEIFPRDFFGIIGHTGSGKSTFVQHLNALIKTPTAEKKYKPKKPQKNKPVPPKTVLRVNGFDLTDKKTDFKALRSKIGMVFQYPEYQLFAETVFDDVAFGLKNFMGELSKEETEAAVRAAIEAVGLRYSEVKDRSPFELSGGQKRRVAIAGVIVTKPEILVLDEPAAGLDPLGKEEIMSVLHTLHADWCKTVIIVSHDMDEIAENCNRAAVFSEGKVVVCDTPKQLFARGKELKTLGLDVPFTANLVEELSALGVQIDCDYTMADFLRKILVYAKTPHPCTRSNLEQGGGENA
ncbi:MAG: energy-coupling factor transporter ATPase [Clostridia bacterium]|nr:energy-coupling factor transporter ATPase [Clostridia bacterium]